MSNDMISVVIPCFNQGKYLPFTVESIIASTHQAVTHLRSPNSSNQGIMVFRSSINPTEEFQKPEMRACALPKENIYCHWMAMT
ncbi:MAG: glycosyltransferase [Chitinophagaceae bacterium]|nr:glycosyltransferase [Chitinophagaceae bacterium]